MKSADKKIASAALAKVQEAQADMEAIRDTLQEAFDGKSERWQEGDAGQAASEEIDTVSAICDSLENSADEFGNIEFD